MRGLKKLTTSIGLLLASILMASTVFAAAGTPAVTNIRADGDYSASSYVNANGIRVENVTDKISGNISDEYVLSATTESERAVTFSASDKVDVIITIDADALVDKYEASGYSSVAEYARSEKGTAYAEKLSAQIASVKERISKKYSVEYEYEYTSAFAGFSATVRYGEISSIKNIKGVKSVNVSERYARPEAATNNVVNVYDTGIYNSEDVGFTGAGTLVGILDTGLDYLHTAFQNIPPKLAVTRDDVDALLGRTTAATWTPGLTVDDVYISDKVPFGYDYADKDSEVYPAEDHGTHVAGIVAGKDDEITGVAVDAQLAIFKVFSNSNETGGADTDILAAVDDAVVLGCDVINMSLGSTAGFSSEEDRTYVNDVYEKVRRAGVSLIVAAGNEASSAKNSTYGDYNLVSNPDSGTVGSPSTYPAAMSVASISGVKTSYLDANNGEAAVYVVEASNSTGEKGEFVKELLGDLHENTYDYVTIPGWGDNADYNNLPVSVKGKIALIKRGISTFEDKCKFAVQHGAIAAIIYNNVSGNISMSVGPKITIPVCSTSMDIGEILASHPTGTIHVSKDNLAGPFMSDFSSWGVLPDLELKPEIAAHGGDIYSSVPGGGYDRISGTSMACPNMAGATTLVRQYIKEKYPEYSNVEVTDLAYRLMMSTATIALNEEGNPYSPRKQGSGLAAIKESVNTGAYLYVEGSNKTKLSLGDDPKRSGVYNLEFKIKNFSGAARSYKVGSYVMTESISSDRKTVAEKAYMLDDASVTTVISGGGSVLRGGVLTVPGYADTTVRMEIKLTYADKEYLNYWFENGMFVEGFATFESLDADKIDLSIPWCAFYGDWGEAPILDASAYEVTESINDSSVLAKDKLKAAVYESIPMGAFRYRTGTDSNGDPIYQDGTWGLGDYGYKLENDDDKPRPVEEKAAISSDINAQYKLSMIALGTLRGVKRADVKIYNTATGEVVYEDTKYNVRKSAFSSARRAGYLELDFNAAERGLADNTQYTIDVKTYLDWEGSQVANKKDTYTSSFYIDSEAPQLESDTVNLMVHESVSGVKTYYLEMYVYDNQYLQAMNIMSYKSISGDTLIGRVPFQDYATPLDSNKGGRTLIRYNITRYYDDIIANGGNIYVEFYDYAKNNSKFTITLPSCDTDEIAFKNNFRQVRVDINGYYDVMRSVDFYSVSTDEDGNVVRTESHPDKAWLESLIWETEDPEIATVDSDGRVWGVSEGSTILRVKSPSMAEFKEVPVTVSSRNVGDIELIEFKMSESRLELEQGEWYDVSFEVKPYNITTMPTVEWISSNEFVAKVVADENDPTKAKVFAVGCKNNGKTADSATITVRVARQPGVAASPITGQIAVTVKRMYKMEGSLIDRFTGRGDEDGVLVIPEDLGAIGVSAGAFMGNQYIKKLVLPEGMQYLYESCFYGMSALEEVVLPTTIKDIPKWCFGWCPNLKKVNFENVRLIKELSFYRSALTELDLPKAVFIGNNAFTSNTKLERVNIPMCNYIGDQAFLSCTSLYEVNFRSSVEIMTAAFAYCSSLKSITIPGNIVGDAAFVYCDNLMSVTFTGYPVIGIEAFAANRNLSSVNFLGGAYDIGSHAFYGCTALESVAIPSGLEKLGEGAFGLCTSLKSVRIAAGAKLSSFGRGVFSGDDALESIEVDAGNAYFKSNDGILYDKNGLTVVYVPAAKDLGASFTVPDSVVAIGMNAFTDVNSEGFAIDLNNVKRIGEGAFAGSNVTTVEGYENLVSIGAGAFENCVLLTDLPISDKLVSLGSRAFYGCTASGTRVKLTIPETLVSIGEYAFYGVKTVGEIVLPDSMTVITPYAFAGCEMLGKVTFGSEIEYIGAYAFSNTRLTSLVLPTTVYALGEGAFADCALLASVTIPENTVSQIPANCFRGSAIRSITLPATVTAIGDYAFAESTPLTTFTIPGVVVIGNGALRNTAVTRFVAPAATVIGSYLFAEEGETNNSLTAVTLNNAKVLMPYAFYGCTRISGVTLPSVTEVGEYAFAGCTALNTVNLAAVESVGKHAFDGASKLGSVSFGESLEKVDEFAFSGTAIKKIQLPATAVSVIEGAFVNATMLTEITVDQANPVFFESGDGVLYKREANGTYTLHTYPGAKSGASFEVVEGVNRIAAYAFYGNKSLSSVKLARSLKTVGAEAFNDCTNLLSYEFLSPKAPTLENFFDEENVGKLVYSNFTGASGSVEGIRMTYPVNGTGYSDSLLYNTIFSGTNRVSEVAALEDVTVETNAAIAALPLLSELTLADRAAVENANVLYRRVTRNQRQYVTDYAKLSAAVTRISELKVAEVVRLIDSLGSNPSKEKVAEAREAYEALSEDERESVTNYKKLQSAERGERGGGGCGAGIVDFVGGANGGIGGGLVLIIGVCALFAAAKRKKEVR